MSGSDKDLAQGEALEGTSAEHPTSEEEVYRVAPSIAAKDTANVLRINAIPYACWKVEDICFQFDRALILYDAKKPFAELKRLWKAEEKRYKPPIIGLFGHADPVGKDPYNKKLSEDRAKALYGVLTREVSTWKEIFDKKAEIQELNVHLHALGYLAGTPTEQFGSDTEAAVRLYMDDLSSDFRLEKKHFLCDGKKAYQGCSEFNPVRVFSEGQNEELAKKENRDERNDENQPNRRVIAFLWHADEKIDPSHWPCPAAQQGIGGCKNRFWRDGDKRRSFQEKARQWNPEPLGGSGTVTSATSRWSYDPARDTFACRFYHRMATFSPCELGRVSLRQETWEITLNAVEIFDHVVAEAHKDVCKILREKYPPKHKNRTNLHLDYGIRAEYAFRLVFRIAKSKQGRWECHLGNIKDVRVQGSEITHPAFSAYYATPNAHRESTVTWKPRKFGVALENTNKVKSLLNQSVSLEFVEEEAEIARVYKPDAQPLVLMQWSPRMARTHPPSGGIAFDWHGFHYDIRPGRKVDDLLKMRHVKIKWPSIEACSASIKEKAPSSGLGGAIDMRDPQLHHFLNGSDHTMPLKHGTKFVFYHTSDSRLHGPKYRDEPLFYLVYAFSMKQSPGP